MLLDNPITNQIPQAEHMEREHLLTARIFAGQFHSCLEKNKHHSVTIFSDDEDHLLVCVRVGRAQTELRFR